MPSSNAALPNSVILFSRTQPVCSSSASAAFHAVDGGGVSQSILSALAAPHFRHSKTRAVKSVRRISGGVLWRRTSCSFHKRTQCPAQSRPARPARCSAEKTLSFSVTSRSIPAETFIRLTRAFPVSMTVETHGTVRDVSAMADDKIMRVRALSGSSRIFFCSANGTELCKVKISSASFGIPSAVSSSRHFLIS